MKANTILLGIATTMLLLAMPAAASDYTIGIFGNANEDDTINMQDVTYTELIILEYRDITDLADAKHDDKINMQDVTQIELVILGKEKELTLIDSAERIVTVNKPIERVIPISSYITEVMRSLEVADRIVAVPSPVVSKNVFFQELAELPNIGGGRGGGYDYEMVVQLQPDLVILYATSYDEVADKIETVVPGITVVRMSCPYMGCEPSVYQDYVKKLGYVFNNKDKSEELFDFYEDCLSQIEEDVEALSDDEKPKVFFVSWPDRYLPVCHTFISGTGIHNAIESAGGINVAADLEASPVDLEWVLSQDPEVIIGTSDLVGYVTDKPTDADMEAEIDTIRSQPGWENLAAVKSDEVYLIGSRLFTSTHYPMGTVYMAKMLHPDLFEDTDPEAMHEEYLTEFQGLDYDLGEHGGFVYPPFE